MCTRPDAAGSDQKQGRKLFSRSFLPLFQTCTAKGQQSLKRSRLRPSSSNFAISRHVSARGGFLFHARNAHHSLKSPACSCVSCNLGSRVNIAARIFSRCSRRREHQLLISMPNPSISPSSSASASSVAPSPPISSTPIPWESMQPRQRSYATRIADPHSGQTTDDSFRWNQIGTLFIGNATI